MDKQVSKSNPNAEDMTNRTISVQKAANPLVELSHVEKHYGKLHVLKDINLTVNKGEVLVIIGPSGSGKSTMSHN